MKALSLWQPWASAIVIGAKRIETRGWSTNYRGTLLIHASKNGSQNQLFERVYVLGLDIALKMKVKKLPLGALIGVADLHDVFSTNEDFEVQGLEADLGDYSSDRFGWKLRDIRAFKKPIPYRGRQGLFNVPDEIVAAAIKTARKVEA